jgi:hypothetical protein
MIMIDRHLDVESFMELLEHATSLSSPKKVGELMFELSEAHKGSRKEIKECWAGMILSLMTPQQSLREEN